jgi:hypothetical protein
MLKFGKFVESINIFSYANFHLYLTNSLLASGGQKRGFPFEMQMALHDIKTLRCRAGKRYSSTLRSDT